MDLSRKNEAFLEEIKKTAANGELLKLSMGNYQGKEINLKKIIIKPILIKDVEKLSFTYRYKTRDIVKNYTVRDGLKKIEGFFNTEFLTASLSARSFDLLFENNKGRMILRKTETALRDIPSLSHDKQKRRLIEAQKTYLHDLNITDAKGVVHKNAQDKFRQINKYIELLDPLLKSLSDRQLHIADMGSGKGYLTFALYDFLQTLGRDVKVTGIEYRKDLVDLCNSIALKSGFKNLSFLKSSIQDYKAEKLDILIALHACDTATDDAIYKGVESGADLIVVAPCCHKQIRNEMERANKQENFEFLTRHGIFLERQAEMVTDGLRALMLEHCGYKVKVFEFISGEHTAKNIMITALRDKSAKSRDEKNLERIFNSMNYFGINSHHLGKLLKLQ